jgi:hypothetical protein
VVAADTADVTTDAGEGDKSVTVTVLAAGSSMVTKRIFVGKQGSSYIDAHHCIGV